MQSNDGRIPVLYLAPWVDVGGSDKGTIDWFRFLDRDRFRPSLITTQPSPNRRFGEVIPYADEAWDLPELMHGDEFPRFIIAFIHTRQIKVVHIMNSRLGFELLPEFASLPRRPRVVVQLHVEETDRSGYVRYVTTRYGNLVDGFSVSSQALSDRLDAYDVPLVKRRLIRTGVDAEREFCPGRVKPIEGLERDRLHILSPVRVTAQKDPLLMVEVAQRLHSAGLRFRIHVLGDGDLTYAVHERVGAAGLENEVLMHGECVDVAPWYAGCDLVLLTSKYEGVPYVAYEAMAMATPSVAPDLPGLRELVTPDTGVLVSTSDGPQGYADAIGELAADPSRRNAMGQAARARVRWDFSLERMAAEHAALYDELLAAANRELPNESGVGQASSAQQLTGALRGRRPRAAPLVSVIVPCFNHGRYLHACLQSIAEQTYSPIETIVVDDASTDPETLDALAKFGGDRAVTLLRMPGNHGPSAARNAAVERASGRYVLPVDADNLLLPDAVAVLVEQLSGAGERIGFIYPNYQFFGNRTDYFEPPSYNLHALLVSNYCDTSSLIDREIFDRGFRYAEDIVLGHEDWDLVLSLAEHGIYGEPARTKTLLYRKHGFTRSDLVEAANVSFRELVARRHPELFATRARLKAEWSPALTLIALDALPAGSDNPLGNLVRAAARQTCGDFEVVVRTAREFWPTELGPRLQRVPTALAGSRAQALAHGLEIARGRYALATYGSPAELLADPTLIEKTLRVLRVNPRINALALEESDPGLPAFRLLDTNRARRAKLGALCWATTGATAPPSSLELAGHHPLETLARWLGAHAVVQWRHLPRRDRRSVASAGTGPAATVGAPRHNRTRDARVREETLAQLPDWPSGIASRLRWPTVWTPPHARLLCRHLHHDSDRYVFTNDRASPPGCSLHHTLGSVRGLPLAGTTSLVIGDDESSDGFALGDPAQLDAPELLGFVELAPLPLLDALQIARHRETGQRVLIGGAEDPLAGIVDVLRGIGYVEPYPIHPRHPPHVDVTYGLVGLIRTVDLSARCHRYGAGHVPVGIPAGELGALFAEPTGEGKPLWIDGDGRVFGEGRAYPTGRPPIRRAMRWTGAPLTWRPYGSFGPKIRATARRAYDSARILAARPTVPAPPLGDPAGYLLRSPTSRTIPLHAWTHPVTGDQLLSTDEREPQSLGYESVCLLGYLIASAPVTGRLGPVRPGIPWASRFGLVTGGS
ncbi:MAG: glycosyltransferase [Solirubrobacteraceae bacterium]